MQGLGGGGRSPSKHADQRHRTERSPLANIREIRGRGLNPVRLVHDDHSREFRAHCSRHGAAYLGREASCSQVQDTHTHTHTGAVRKLHEAAKRQTPMKLCCERCVFRGWRSQLRSKLVRLAELGASLLKNACASHGTRNKHEAPLVHTVFDTSWRTLAQLSPSTVTADNQCAVDICISVHKAVESSLQETTKLVIHGVMGPWWCSSYSTHLPPRANLVRFPARSPLSFLQVLPYPMLLQYGVASHSSRFTIIGSQDLNRTTTETLHALRVGAMEALGLRVIVARIVPSPCNDCQGGLATLCRAQLVGRRLGMSDRCHESLHLDHPHVFREKIYAETRLQYPECTLAVFLWLSLGIGKFREFNDLCARLLSPLHTGASAVCSLAVAPHLAVMGFARRFLANLLLAQRRTSSEGGDPSVRPSKVKVCDIFDGWTDRKKKVALQLVEDHVTAAPDGRTDGRLTDYCESSPQPPAPQVGGAPTDCATGGRLFCSLYREQPTAKQFKRVSSIELHHTIIKVKPYVTTYLHAIRRSGEAVMYDFSIDTSFACALTNIVNVSHFPRGLFRFISTTQLLVNTNEPDKLDLWAASKSVQTASSPLAALVPCPWKSQREATVQERYASPFLEKEHIRFADSSWQARFTARCCRSEKAVQYDFLISLRVTRSNFCQRFITRSVGVFPNMPSNLLSNRRDPEISSIHPTVDYTSHFSIHGCFLPLFNLKSAAAKASFFANRNACHPFFCCLLSTHNPPGIRPDCTRQRRYGTIGTDWQASYFFPVTRAAMNRSRDQLCRPPSATASGLNARWDKHSNTNRIRFPVRSPPGFSHVGIVPDYVAGQRVFSGISRFPRPCIPALLHAHLTSP
ncbi:hypothetical protein PR048_027247 [Dryococelus australis]|uniref:Uncharacterized protein n=1 Tax=Dryococelus australis TaxID=614101 RepID=A0ABQ9GEX5_9NEOP|nr:hypothetical protein PR048_027247 [Dryococelus australis]